MSTSFVALKCPSCGENLDVYENAEHFACGYCGAQIEVRRRGGTVSLKALTDAIQRVRRGTDRTADSTLVAAEEGNAFARGSERAGAQTEGRKAARHRKHPMTGIARNHPSTQPA